MSDERIDKLERLARLKASGDITEAEFESEKASVLAGNAVGNAIESARKRRLIYQSVAAVIGIAICLTFAVSLLQRQPAVEGSSGDSQTQVALSPPPALPSPMQVAPVDVAPVAATPQPVAPLADLPPRTVPPKIEGDWRYLRTRIREGWGTKPTFANRYVIIRVGCGTGCTGNIVGDHRTGDIYSLGLGGEGYDQLQLRYSNANNLLTASWGEIESQTCVVQRYRWNGTELEEIGAKQTSPRIDYACDQLPE